MAVNDETPVPVLRTASRHGSDLVDRAYTRIRDAIANLVFQPGQPLTEASVAEWLGMGRTPVREALLMLRHEGLVESVPRKNYFVSRISATEAQEIYEMLEGLEGVAAKLAAERATPEELDRLDAAMRRMEDALAWDDLDEWAAADDAMHEIILEAARNKQIQSVVRSLHVRIKRMRLFTLRMRQRLPESSRLHRAEVDAILSRDGELAREASQNHRVHASREMIEIIRRLGPASTL